MIIQQVTLLKDIFLVSISKEQNFVYLPDLSKDCVGQSFIKNDTLFDSLLFQRLQYPKTKILQYLSQCYTRCQVQKDKPWNQSLQSKKFIQIAQQRIIGYTIISMQQKQMFTQQQFSNPQLTTINQSIFFISCSLVYQLQRGMADDHFWAVIIKLSDKFLQLKSTILQEVLKMIKKHHDKEDKSTRLINVLIGLLTRQQFRQQFYTLKRFPFRLTNAIDIQNRNCLGPLLRVSSMGFSPDFKDMQNIMQDVQSIKRNKQRYDNIMANIVYKKQFECAVKQIQFRHFQVTQQIAQIFKLLLKKDTQKKTLEWLSNAIILLYSRSQMGHMFSDQYQGASDGASLLILDVMLEISKVILDPQNKKWGLIDPDYMVVNKRYITIKYQPLNNSRQPRKAPSKQYGTVSQFFFMCMQLLSVSLLPCIHKLTRLMQSIQKIEQQLKKGHPQYMKQKLKQQQRTLKGKYLVYYSILTHQHRIRTLTHLSQTFLCLLPKWLNLDLGRMKQGMFPGFVSNGMEKIIPQSFILSLLQIHSTMAQLIPDYGQKYLTNIYEQFLNMALMLLSPIKLSDNPHTAANIIKTLYKISFSGSRNKNTCQNILANHQLSQHNLARLIIQFYINVANTGSSNQYYQKFQYRHYANQLLKLACNFEPYRKSIRFIQKEQIFKRFLNSLVSDANFMLDHASQSIKKLQQIQKKKQQGKQLGEQELRQGNPQGIQYIFKQLSDNIKLIAQFSIWSNTSFKSEQLQIVLVPMLNNFLRSLIDPESDISNKQLTRRFKLKSQFILKEILTVLGNLRHDQNFISQIVKDQRSYDIQLYLKAKQKAQYQNATTDQLIKTLSNYVDMDKYIQNFPQQYQCQLFFTLLKDPVKLPTSNSVVQRSHIHSHLLGDQRDPFNRMPLKVTDLIPMPQLKQQIQQWKKKKLQEILGTKKKVEKGQKLVETHQEELLSLHIGRSDEKYDKS